MGEGLAANLRFDARRQSKLLESGCFIGKQMIEDSRIARCSRMY